LKIFNIPFALVLDRDALVTNHLLELMDHLDIKLATANQDQLIRELRDYKIYVFDNGDLEANYPRRYQTGESKSMNALRAANLISSEEFYSAKMQNLRRVIENL